VDCLTGATANMPPVERSPQCGLAPRTQGNALTTTGRLVLSSAELSHPAMILLQHDELLRFVMLLLFPGNKKRDEPKIGPAVTAFRQVRLNSFDL